jgi:mannose-6-phosphate isomerase-like protein (cupin superfamily)
MSDAPRAVIVRPGEGARVGNVEFLARTVDTPRFNLGVIDFAAGRVLEPHVHADEDDSFFILSGEITFMLPDGDVVARPGTFVLIPPGVEHGFRNDTSESAQILNIHAPGGFDRRVGLED